MRDAEILPNAFGYDQGGGVTIIRKRLSVGSRNAIELKDVQMDSLELLRKVGDSLMCPLICVQPGSGKMINQRRASCHRLIKP